MLTAERFNHSVEVSKEAVRLARLYGGDVGKAETAGLLHDICKDTDKSVLLKLFEDNHIALNEQEKRAPKLWHAIAGALFVERELGIKDTDILNAVRYHTTARAGMSLTEKIIYVADFTSPDRSYPGVEKIRQKAGISLEECMREALSFTICDLAGRNMPIHTETVAAYNEINGERNAKDESFAFTERNK